MQPAPPHASNADDYRARFRRVLEHVDAHLGEDLSLDQLSRIAAFSKFHFQRQFTSLFGVGVYRYVQLARMKRASHQLAYRDDSILEIALANRYEGPEAFSRAFKKTFGQSPSDFRKQPDWEAWHATYRSLTELRSQHMKPNLDATRVEIVDFPETRVAVLEHHGPPSRLGDSIRKFIEWRRNNGLHPRVSATFNIAYDNPVEVTGDDFRFDLCAATTRDVPADSGIVIKTIPAGRAGVYRHRGSDDTLEATLRFLYSEWLPESGEELRDFPLYFRRVSFYPDVPENEATTDIFLPLASKLG